MRKNFLHSFCRKKIEIVHSSIEQRNILQTNEINFMRRSPKLLVTKKYFCKPPPHSKIKRSIPPISLADDYNSCTRFFFFLKTSWTDCFFATKASKFWGALCILNQCWRDRLSFWCGIYCISRSCRTVVTRT